VSVGASAVPPLLQIPGLMYQAHQEVRRGVAP
jgi:hypothetical protein